MEAQMTRKLVKYGINKEYLPDWGYAEALREIYQNFNDFGEFDTDIEEISDALQAVTLYNKFCPMNLTFLSIGNSSKRDDPDTVGKHGEGLKMAMFVFCRLGMDFVLFCNGRAYEPTFYIDELIGECFGIQDIGPSDIKDGFAVSFNIPTEDFSEFCEKQLKPGDVQFSHRSGDIIDREPGSIYVGGIFVCVMKDMKHAYNFKPRNISLDRDRKIPSTFDVYWHASMILSSWEKLTVEDLFSTEAHYVDNIPAKLLKQVKPEIVDGEIVFRFGKHIARGNLAKVLMDKMELNVRSLKEDLASEESPYARLKAFKKRHGWNLEGEAKIDFDLLIDASSKWKKRKDK